MKSLFLLMTCFFSLHAFAHESVGGRGGGTGVQCGNKPSILLEQYELKNEGIKNAIPRSRYQVHRFMKRMLKSQPDLFKKWEKNWLKIGAYKDWKTSSAFDYSVQIGELIAKIFSNTVSDSVAFENDDLVDLPKDCNKVQFAYFFEATVYKYDNLSYFFYDESHNTDHLAELTKTTQRYLELHESLFMTGTSEYAHLFPHKTRDLLKSLSSGLVVFQKAVAEFIKISPDIDLVQSLSGVYESTPGEDIIARGCPWQVIYIVESPERISEMAVYLKSYIPSIDKVDRRILSALPTNLATSVENEITFISKDTGLSCRNKLRTKAGRQEGIKEAKIAQQVYLALELP